MAAKVPKGKKQLTINIDEKAVDYFKSESESVGIPYQTLINLYLVDCAKKNKKCDFSWDTGNTTANVSDKSNSVIEMSSFENPKNHDDVITLYTLNAINTAESRPCLALVMERDGIVWSVYPDYTLSQFTAEYLSGILGDTVPFSTLTDGIKRISEREKSSFRFSDNGELLIGA